MIGGKRFIHKEYHLFQINRGHHGPQYPVHCRRFIQDHDKHLVRVTTYFQNSLEFFRILIFCLQSDQLVDIDRGNNRSVIEHHKTGRANIIMFISPVNKHFHRHQTPGSPRRVGILPRTFRSTGNKKDDSEDYM